MAAPLIRILSDLHYGERASRVKRLDQLRPLFDGASRVILNGDTLDTRPGPNPAHTAACRAEVLEFFPRAAPAVTFVTGNHDADFSSDHFVDLAGDDVFVVHGDIFFENLVPWGRDAAQIEQLVATELRALPPELHHSLTHRFAVIRRVAAAVPQRHQAERHRLKYFVRFLADTVWPPDRMLRVVHAWRAEPAKAAATAQRHRPRARFVVSGHTHRPNIRPLPQGPTLINTGSYCPPLGATAVDITEHSLVVRSVELQRGEFRLGPTLAQFPLAGK